MDTDATPDGDQTGWKGPVNGPKNLPKHKEDYPRLTIKNSFEPLNRVPEPMDSATIEASSSQMEASSKSSEARASTKEKPPPPIIIHGFVENFHDLKQMLYRNVGKNFNVKFTGRNTTIYTLNKRDWNKVKGILSQNETSYHTFTHKEEKTHAFVLRGLCQNPAPEEVKAALEEEHNLVAEKVFKMRTKRPTFLIITNKNVNIKTLDSEIRNLLNTRVNWERHINNKLITQCHRCQRWGHATSNCQAAARCLKCAGPHFTYTHTEIVPKDKIKCANCNQGHVANDTICPVYQKRIENINLIKEQQNTTKHTETLVPAPIPTTNPWNKNKTENSAQTSQSNKSPTENNQPATATATATATGLLTELKKLNELININEVIRAISDLNKMLSKTESKEQKFNTILEFSARINEYHF
ncbi:hypothetical protein MTP99_014375 [Tenebrio molitor]|nr:hypothetical protein MTP99_014375 [Tenebrio molitor]